MNKINFKLNKLRKVTKKLSEWMTRNQKIIIVLLFIFAIAIALSSRLLPIFKYNGFLYDQARDSLVIDEMKKGVFPTLGPSSAVGSYSLPPSYFYLSIPFVYFSSHPSAHVLVNSIFSFASIFMFAYLIYVYSPRNLGQERRLLLSSVASVLLSVNFSIYSLAVGSWNPNPIPFFILLTLILCEKILSEEKISKLRMSIYWISLGTSIGIMLGLHSVTLFIMPIFYFIFSIYFIHKNPSKVLFPVLGLFIISITLLPYLQGEVARGFTNTAAIKEQIFMTNGSNQSIIDRINRIAFYQLQINNEAFYASTNKAAYLFSFLAALPLLFIGSALRLQKNITSLYILVWMLFLILGSSFTGDVGTHYFLIVIFLPIIFIFSGFFQKNYRSIFVIPILITYILFSTYLNIRYMLNFFNRELNNKTRISVEEKVEIIKKIPSDSNVCNEFSTTNNIDLLYISKNMLGKNISYDNQCEAGDYLINNPSDNLNGFYQIIFISEKYIIRKKV